MKKDDISFDVMRTNLPVAVWWFALFALIYLDIRWFVVWCVIVFLGSWIVWRIAIKPVNDAYEAARDVWGMSVICRYAAWMNMTVLGLGKIAIKKGYMGPPGDILDKDLGGGK